MNAPLPAKASVQNLGEDTRVASKQEGPTKYGRLQNLSGSCGQVCEAKHACLHTDKDAVSLRLRASLPRAYRTRAVLTGESRQTRKGCL